jgi:hypothetical protein
MAPKPETTVATVLSKCNSLRTISAHFAQAISGASSEIPPPPTEGVFKALAAAPTVFKAQATKLGLLLVNKPLTLSAIQPILVDLETRVVPALFTNAAQVFGRKEVFGKVYVAEVVALLRDVLGTVEDLTGAVSKVVKEERISKDEVLFAVGKVYSTCDELIAVAEKEVIPILMRKVRGFAGLVEDGISELKEWQDDIDEDAEDPTSGDEDKESDDERQRTIEELTAGLSIGSSDRLPRYRKDIVNLLEETLRRADLVLKLFQALSKRRVKRFIFQPPPFLDKEIEAKAIKQMRVLDEALDLMEMAQNQIDELAGALYDLDADKSQDNLDALTSHAKAAADLVAKPWKWEGEHDDDDFTKWIVIWTKLIQTKAQKVASGD